MGVSVDGCIEPWPVESLYSWPEENLVQEGDRGEQLVYDDPPIQVVTQDAAATTESIDCTYIKYVPGILFAVVAYWFFSKPRKVKQ